MADIFLSYASEDRERVRQLVDRFEAHGWTVWWDRRILPGKTWPQMIQEGLDSTKAMVVVWSERSVESKWVAIEATKGDARGTLVPVLIDDVEPPLEFSRIHAADLRHWVGSARHPELLAVIEALERSLGMPSSGEEHPDPTPSSTTAIKPASTRREWIRDAFIGFVGLGGLTLIGLALTAGLPTETRDLFTSEPFVVVFAVVTSGLAGALAGAVCKRNRLAIAVAVASVLICWGVGLWIDPRYEGTQGGTLVGGLVGALFAYVTRRLARLRHDR